MAAGSPSPAPMTLCSSGMPPRSDVMNSRRTIALARRSDGSRHAARDEVNRIVGAWVECLDHQTVVARCRDADVPASLIYSIADIFEDPQYRARGNIRMVDSRIGQLAVPDVVPRLSATPGKIDWLGAAVGAHNDEVFRDLLRLDASEMNELRERGVI